jgi:hypothetical protein
LNTILGRNTVGVAFLKLIRNAILVAMLLCGIQLFRLKSIGRTEPGAEQTLEIA